MKFSKSVVFILLIGLAFSFSLSAESHERNSIDISATAEIGILKVLYHDIQIGEGTHRFNYMTEGGQELLQLYNRFEVEGLIASRHEVSFLYQPLTLLTQTRVDKNITIDDITFKEDTPLDLKYGFDFFRGTYRYRFLDNGTWRASAGMALQLRNASIIFDGFDTSGDEARVVTQDLGPVPVLSFSARRDDPRGFFLETGLDGFYAPVRYLNLRDVDVIGWLYDGAVRVGVSMDDYGEFYVSLRFLGGGADGTASSRTRWTQSKQDPRYTRNNLNLAVLSLGVRLK